MKKHDGRPERANGGGSNLHGGADVRENATEMRLADWPFEQMKRGEKTVEVRLYDEKRRKLREGDLIYFYRADRSECLSARVKALHIAPTFGALFALPNMLSKAGFSDMPPSDAVKCMYKYYTEAQEMQWGVLGIELDFGGSPCPE